MEPDHENEVRGHGHDRFVREYRVWVGLVTPGFRKKVVKRSAQTALAAFFLCISSAACDGAPSSVLRTTALAPYGLGHINNANPYLLVGTTAWCVTGGPVRLTTLEWKEGRGLEITAFAVVNQKAGDDRIGTEPGQLASAGLVPSNREVTTSCTPARPGDPAMISYVVLELNSGNLETVTHGRGLVAQWQDSQGRKGMLTEDLSIIFCPSDSQDCDDSKILET